MRNIIVLALVLIGMVNAQFNQEYLNAIMKEAQAEEPQIQGRNFICPISGTYAQATSVHALRPNDIKVIGAIGDSLSAANGAKAMTIIGLLDECRGVAWNMGGEQDVYKVFTLANVLRQFNPNLVGYSTGTGKYASAVAGFNVAQPGHTSHEMYQQAVELVTRIKTSSQVNADNDWKLITFFIGGNDLCKSCKDAKYTTANYINNVKAVLDYFKANLKRTFINLVTSLDVTGIELLSGTTCRNMQKTLCECGLADAYTPNVKQFAKEIQKETEDLIASGRYDTADDFTVVIQPFMKDMTPPMKGTAADYSFFAPDCFHFSLKGHAAAGLELWNNMLTPVGQKDTKWMNIGGTTKCPSASQPYLFTAKNSKSFQQQPSLLRNLLNQK